MTLKKTTPATKKPAKVSSTLKLAHHLGLSEWTVSRAINGHPEVKAATRERVLKAMEEIGFRPNPVARGLSGKAMGMVGVCFGNAQNALMIDKITILDEFLRQHQLGGMLAISPPDQESQVRILADFMHLRLDGIVLVQSYISPPRLRKMLEGVKCVHVDPPALELTPGVSLDRQMAMRMIMAHLFALGHRSFGVLGYSSGMWTRWEGIVQALEEKGLSVEKNLQTFELEKPGAESFAEGIQLAELAFRAPRRPTALIAINDRVAAGAMQGLRDLGLRIPEDISVVGFDNLDVGQYLRPRLTTIDQQPQLLMRTAGEMLLTQLGITPNKGGSDRVRIEPLLIERESTGPAPRAAKKARA